MRTTIYSFLLLSVFFASCSDDDDKITGSGNVVTETRTLDDFTKIEYNAVLVTSFNIQVGDALEMEITGEDNIIELITTDVSGDELIVSNPDDIEVDEIENVRINLKVPELTQFDHLGISPAQINSLNLDGTFTLNHTGIGNIRFSASSVETVNITHEGIGEINAFGLTAGTVCVNQSGIGNLEITCSDELKGTLTGIGDIEYMGSPTINIEDTGIGDVNDAN